MPSDHLSVLPPLLDAGCAEELEKSGRTLHATSSPLNETFAVYPASSVGASLRPIRDLLTVFKSQLENLSAKHHVFSPDDQLVYFVSSEALPLSERRLVCYLPHPVSHPVHQNIPVRRGHIHHLCCVAELAEIGDTKWH